MSTNEEKRFAEALEAVQRRDFDELKKAMEVLGFRFKQGKNPQHWTYIHPDLRGDPQFQYPRNLYRPHGSRRNPDLIARHDQSQAKQVIQALKARLGTSESGEDET